MLSAKEMNAINSREEKLIAIMVANWKEANVIEQMVSANLDGINYGNYFIFLGVYPNDKDTLAAANRLAARYDQVYVVENTVFGPTTKGQMLNQIAREIIRVEVRLGRDFDIFLIQDAEDIVHSHALKLINALQRQADFIQLPVFSYKRRQRDLVGSTYLDEFSVSHTKDLLLRQDLDVTIPSAGVGTALSRKLILKLMAQQDGKFLIEEALTEDYFLGFASKRLGFKSLFACFTYENENGKKEFIATREYFPNSIIASIKQKSRWIAGIVFQGKSLLAWQGGFAERYFLLRDRSGPINSLIVLASMGVMIFYFSTYGMYLPIPEVLLSPLVQIVFFSNLGFLIFHLLNRASAVFSVYGISPLLLIPVRGIISNFINIGATFRAWQTVKAAQEKNQKTLVWEKTHHELPVEIMNRYPGAVADIRRSERTVV